MSRSDEFKTRSEKAKRGGAPKYHESNAAAGKLFCRERIALLCDDGGKDFVEDGLLANATAPRSARRRRGDRHRARARPAGRDHGQRLDGQGRLVGRPHGREDHPHPGDGGPAAAAALLPGRFGGRAHHRSDRHVPRAPARGTDLRQPGEAVGRGAADLPPVRAVGGGGRLHPGVLRRRLHGRQERVDVPRLAAHGRDGDRREGDAGGDGRRAHALRGVGVRRSAGARRACLHRGGARLPGVPAPAGAPAGRRPAARRGAARADRRARSGSTTSFPPTRTRRSASTTSSTRWSTRAASSSSRSCSRASSSPASRAWTGARWASSPASRSGRAGCCSSTPPTRRRASSGCATPSGCRWCSWPTCPAS